MWWFLFDTLYDESSVGLTDTERATNGPPEGAPEIAKAVEAEFES
jgi:hypothetical protein